MGDVVEVGRATAEHIVGLDPHDLGISAVQCRIVHDPEAVMLQNVSTSRSVWVKYRDEVSPHRIQPGGGHLLTGDALLLVTGIVQTHPLGIQPPVGYAARPAPAGGDTVVGAASLSDREAEALLGLFAGYLRRRPRHRPEPLSYEEAATLLGEDATASTVRKRVERVRERVNASGGAFVDGRNTLWDLAEHLIDTGRLHPADLVRIGEDPVWRGPVRR